MSYLASLREDAVLLDVFRAYPEVSRPLLRYHHMLLRGPSPLAVAERELIAAYVSGLNDCTYCHGVHSATASAFGVAEETLTSMLGDLAGTPLADPLSERLKPLLEYVRTLTLTPERIGPSDAAAVFAAGWNEQALHDAVSICGLFNLMNRLVNGLGVTADESYLALSGKRLRDIGYDGLVELL